MASAAEQLAAHINFGQLSKATELKKRLWFTLGALIIYRLGTYIPLPGIDPTQLQLLENQTSDGLLGLLNLFTGGAFSQASIMALGIMPYISASIVIQLLGVAVPYIQKLQHVRLSLWMPTLLNRPVGVFYHLFVLLL